MVNHSSDLDGIFHALADATRRGILAELSRSGETSVGELGKPYRMSAPAISKHLRVLENVGLVERKIEGRIHYCRLSAAPLGEAAVWIAETRRFWEAKFDALARHLELDPR
jgi:DNA-binding transcriptional ArsR family regulator